MADLAYCNPLLCEIGHCNSHFIKLYTINAFSYLSSVYTSKEPEMGICSIGNIGGYQVDNSFMNQRTMNISLLLYRPIAVHVNSLKIQRITTFPTSTRIHMGIGQHIIWRDRCLDVYRWRKQRKIVCGTRIRMSARCAIIHILMKVLAQ